jgi:CMP/dCMP kinase
MDGFNRALTIAIDGPSGAGKGTVARAVAAELGYRHVDSGAMYRAVAWRALRVGLSLTDEGALARLAEQARLDVLSPGVRIDGEDVTHAIRNPEIDRAAAAVARLPKVRAVLVDRLRQAGSGGAVVMEGRDIGSVVFPRAEVKIYLDAAPDERARRRASDPAHSGVPAAISDVASALCERDAIDRTRSASPLSVSPDAIVIDTTGKSIAEVVREVMGLVTKRMADG